MTPEGPGAGPEPDPLTNPRTYFPFGSVSEYVYVWARAVRHCCLLEDGHTGLIDPGDFAIDHRGVFDFVNDGEDSISVPVQEIRERIGSRLRLDHLNGQVAQMPGDGVNGDGLFTAAIAFLYPNLAEIMNVAQPQRFPALSGGIRIFHDPDDLTDSLIELRHARRGAERAKE